jgi:hypothetical protein
MVEAQQSLKWEEKAMEDSQFDYQPQKKQQRWG